MKGACVLINGNQPNGRFIEGIISGTPAPGMFMEVVPATEPINGRFTFRAASIGSAGDRRPTIILLEDAEQGVVPDVNGANTYTSGRRGFLYVPHAGDELNILIKNLAGTGDSHAIGDQIMNDVATGKGIVQAAAANFAPFTLLETSAGLTADTMLACMFN